MNTAHGTQASQAERAQNIAHVVRGILASAGLPDGASLRESVAGLPIDEARDAHDTYARALESLAGEYRGHRP